MADPCVAFCELCGWEGPDRAIPAQAAADADEHHCRFIRATHPYAYRSGQWAQIAAVVDDCFLVVFEDGHTDRWVVDDPHAGYQFAESVPAGEKEA